MQPRRRGSGGPVLPVVLLLGPLIGARGPSTLQPARRRARARLHLGQPRWRAINETRAACVGLGGHASIPAGAWLCRRGDSVPTWLDHCSAGGCGPVYRRSSGRPGRCILAGAGPRRAGAAAAAGPARATGEAPPGSIAAASTSAAASRGRESFIDPETTSRRESESRVWHSCALRPAAAPRESVDGGQLTSTRSFWPRCGSMMLRACVRRELDLPPAGARSAAAIDFSRVYYIHGRGLLLVYIRAAGARPRWVFKPRRMQLSPRGIGAALVLLVDRVDFLIFYNIDQ